MFMVFAVTVLACAMAAKFAERRDEIEKIGRGMVPAN